MERPLTRNIRDGMEPLDITAYEKAGGYQAVHKALKQMSPKELVDLVTASNLRGRGGAGFPTGQKWATVPMGDDVPRPKYLVVDADEMEPGTFKDRFLMEGDPHQLIEGIILGAYAIQADIAFIFLRHEYTKSAQRLTRAMAEAYDHGYLGSNIAGSGFSLQLRLHMSAGRYICGEGTAMLNSMQGGRAIPRHRLPHPTISGLWGKPTNINNAETLCCLPHIVNNGADWFKGLSRCKDGGTKIYGASGKVKRPGAWELPMGTPIREILEEHAGGMRERVKFRAVIPGGASTEFLMEDHLDVPMDYDSVSKAGSRMGTGMLIVLDDQTCPVGMVHNLEHFFARESCGWCAPCREGLPWAEKILKDIEEGRGHPDDLERLDALGKDLWLGRTFCALAPGAMEPLRSALVHFRDDFERHIREKRCPWR